MNCVWTASIHEASPHAVFTVLHQEHTDEALKAVRHGYEKSIQRLEGKLEAYQEAFSQALDQNQPIHIGNVEHMGNTFNTTSGRDTIIATDQASVHNSSSQDVINLIEKTITENDSTPDDKENAKEKLDKITQELAKPEPDKGRIKQYYNVGIHGKFCGYRLLSDPCFLAPS